MRIRDARAAVSVLARAIMTTTAAPITRPRISVAVTRGSGSWATLLSSGPLRTVRARHQAHGSSKPLA